MENLPPSLSFLEALCYNGAEKQPFSGGDRVRFKTKKLIQLALLAALEVALSRFLSINTPINKIGFAFVPLALAGMLYGPLAGAAVGAVADLLGATLFPSGPFFPGFTLTAALKGLVYGLCLNRDNAGRWGPVLTAVSVNAAGFSLVLNTFWIYLLYHSDLTVLLASRAAQELFLIPVQTVTLHLLCRSPLRRVWAVGQ